MSYLSERREHSERRLQELSERITAIRELRGVPTLSIYVTGSYGRLEASRQSDLDLFFVYDEGHQEDTISKLTKTLIDAELIRIVREMKFPDFSNEGVYLEIHPLGKMLHALGGRDDDYHNFFTARMLLLLESRPVFNDEVYRKIIQPIVEAYFRDYHDHERDFRPIFLVNDIIRFWKTMCLNYENKRNTSSDDPSRKRKNHLRNLKLKFSRLLTCFSTVIPLCATPRSSPKEILGLIQEPPLERIRTVVQNDEERASFLVKSSMTTLGF